MYTEKDIKWKLTLEEILLHSIEIFYKYQFQKFKNRVSSSNNANLRL